MAKEFKDEECQKWIAYLKEILDGKGSMEKTFYLIGCVTAFAGTKDERSFTSTQLKEIFDIAREG